MFRMLTTNQLEYLKSVIDADDLVGRRLWLEIKEELEWRREKQESVL